MSELTNAAVAWLSERAVPVWLFLVALLTSPWTWSRIVRERAGALFERVAPTGDGGE